MAQSAFWGVINHSLPTFIKMARIAQVCFITVDKKVEYEKRSWAEENIKRTCRILLILLYNIFLVCFIPSFLEDQWLMILWMIINSKFDDLKVRR